MGNFLDTPITEKETEVGEDGKCSYGLSAMQVTGCHCHCHHQLHLTSPIPPLQGWRAQMEDDHIQMLSVSDALPNVSLFGVFDGHGGDMVAHYSARHFPKHLTDALDAGDLKPDLAGFDGKAKAAFESSLMALDNELQHLQDVASGQDQSGSTSVQCLISPTSIVCANTGDSRAVLARGGDAVPLSHDHKPYNPEEKARIEAAGSHVKFNRVNGDLAVSRALGDFVYKRCETVAADRQAVTAFPEVRLTAVPALARARTRTTDCFGAARRARRRAPASPPRAPPPGLNPARHRDGSLMLHLLSRFAGDHGGAAGRRRVCRDRVRRDLGRDVVAGGRREGPCFSRQRPPAAAAARCRRQRRRRRRSDGGGRRAAGAAGGAASLGPRCGVRGAHRPLPAARLSRQHVRRDCALPKGLAQAAARVAGCGLSLIHI